MALTAVRLKKVQSIELPEDLTYNCVSGKEALLEQNSETNNADVDTNRTTSNTYTVTPLKRKNSTVVDETNIVDKKFVKIPTPITAGAVNPRLSTNLPITVTKIKSAAGLVGSPLASSTPTAARATTTATYDSNKAMKIEPGTAIKIASIKRVSFPLIPANGNLNQFAVRRPTIFIKGPIKKSIRNVTVELITKSPKLHLGITSDRLEILKTVAFQKANITNFDLYLTLKKLRVNESFAILGEYFEYSESEVQKIFARTVIKLAKYLKFLIRWPEGEKYDRHKNLPISFRSKLSYVQSLIECVETDIRSTQCPTLDTVDCKNFKFVLAITPSGVISYVSEAYIGSNDDLAIFNACNFRNMIPTHLSLVAVPGKAISDLKNDFDSDSTTDSADETDDNNINKDIKKKISLAAAHSSMNIVNSHLTSHKVKDFSIPTLHVREPTCRLQIRDVIYSLREFKIIQPYAVLEPHLYQYINEILVIISALTNLQR